MYLVPVLSKPVSLLPKMYQKHSTVLTIQGTGPLRVQWSLHWGKWYCPLLVEAGTTTSQKKGNRFWKMLCKYFYFRHSLLLSASKLHQAIGLHWVPTLWFIGTMKKNSGQNQSWVYAEELGSRETWVSDSHWFSRFLLSTCHCYCWVAGLLLNHIAAIVMKARALQVNG